MQELKFGDRVKVKREDNYQTYFWRKGIVKAVKVKIEFRDGSTEMVDLDGVHKGW